VLDSVPFSATITSISRMFPALVENKASSEMHWLAIAKACVLDAPFARFCCETETFGAAPGCGSGTEKQMIGLPSLISIFKTHNHFSGVFWICK